jgi:hypothetical protein
MLKDYYNEETKTLNIPYDFKEELQNIPEETEKIFFLEDRDNDKSSYFNKPVDNLPKNLTHLTFGYSFNQPVNYLPKTLTHLIFGCRFNQSVNNLPLSLTHLTFGNMFNRPVDNLPKNLTHLFFVDNYHKPIVNLPKKLTHLCLPYFDYATIDNLPVNLTHLIVGHNTKQITLPENLIYLRLDCDFDKNKIPKSVKEIMLYCDNNLLNNLPEHIEKVFIIFSFDDNYNKNISNLPITIKEIIIKNKKYEKYIKKPFDTILTINEKAFEYCHFN